VASDRLEWAKHMEALWNARDLDQWFEEVRADVEFTPDPSFPDYGTYSGDALRKWFEDWMRTWKDNRFEILDFDERGDVGLMRSRWHLAAPESGGEVPVADFTMVIWWEEPEAVKPHRIAAFFDHDEAEKAAAGTG
jgi:ketosteroid isomerase-like protein